MNNLKHNKWNRKSQVSHGYSPLYFLVAGIMFLIMAFVLVGTINTHKNSFIAYHKEIPNDIYAYRAINTCLAYQDNFTKRFYPGLIDITKYNESVFDNCYSNTSIRSFNVQLVDNSPINPKEYRRILVGFGAAMYIKEYSVLIREKDGSQKYGSLLIGVSD